MITLIWYILSGKETEDNTAIARGNKEGWWGRNQILFFIALIEALAEFTAAVMVAKALLTCEDIDPPTGGRNSSRRIKKCKRKGEKWIIWEFTSLWAVSELFKTICPQAGVLDSRNGNRLTRELF